ncbi:LuxR family two component transcriptional regulator [Leucobacter luti]|uniref:response regulator n=1 Tax=Leucobacter luti TaxID=340320 RepID=UPI0010458976|nr:response regulator transcription factor [Leucobacter luti]MCW2289573.1 DNA-binding NarL/FixJ family response regulator [Leucobacter luti]TCK37745.1 LuxR family two component transcriptional regulator [Leucobacter luti]
MIRILLVDDHPILRHGMRALLETQADFAVLAEAGSLAEADAQAAAHPIDVALVDLDLGDGEPSGIEVTRAIRAMPDPARVIVFTAFDSDADVVRAADAGASGYLVKDSRPHEVFHAIRAAANGDGVRAGNIAERLGRRIEHPDDALTGRELEVLALVAAGLSNREVASQLVVSEATVKTHLHHAFTKLGSDNRQAAVATAVKRGLIRI